MSEQPSRDIPADDGAAADVRADAEVPIAVEGASGGPAWRAQLRRADLEPCQFPGGCANTMEYAGSGRRPKYCYQVVGGVMHDRVNAKRILDGGTPARRRGEADDALARPVARAGQSVTDQVAALIARLDHSSSELRDALDTLADPEAVAAEIASAQRAARAEVDAAQAAADEARAAAELARDTATAAREVLEGEIAQVRAELGQRDTELAAALAERDTLAAARDSTIAARDAATAESARVTAELQALTREPARVETELADARRQVEVLVVERDTAAADLGAARRDLDRAETDRARLADELHEVREQAVEHRAARAAAESSLAALREQLNHDVDRERAYGEQRLADAEARHNAQLTELRTDLARLRGQIAGRTPEPDTGPELGPGRAASGRKARPRAAQRRPGPTATTPDTTPADQTRSGDHDVQE